MYFNVRAMPRRVGYISRATIFAKPIIAQIAVVNLNINP